MLERFWMNADGTLSSVMEFHDPENFSRLPLHFLDSLYKGHGGPDKARMPSPFQLSATWIRSSGRFMWMVSWKSTSAGRIVGSKVDRRFRG